MARWTGTRTRGLTDRRVELSESVIGRAGDLHQTDNAYSRNASTARGEGEAGKERGTRLRKDRGWALQGKRYLRGWKIDSNLATLLAVLNEHLPAMVHNHIIPPWSSPSRYVHHHRRRRCFLPSSCHLPASSVFLPWPSQDSSIYIGKINIWASSGSFARAVNKLGCAARVSDSQPTLSLIRCLSSAPFSRRQRSTSCGFLSRRSSLLSRPARMALMPDCTDVV